MISLCSNIFLLLDDLHIDFDYVPGLFHAQEASIINCAEALGAKVALARDPADLV